VTSGELLAVGVARNELVPRFVADRGCTHALVPPVGGPRNGVGRYGSDQKEERCNQRGAGRDGAIRRGQRREQERRDPEDHRLSEPGPRVKSRW
jgi:hypothetical protein